MPEGTNKLAEELARFEGEIRGDDNEPESIEQPTAEVVEDEPSLDSDTADSGQPADSDDSVDDSGDAQEASNQVGTAGGEEKSDPYVTTLPDDKEAFGELAGQKVTAKQILEAGLMEKFATWGHQGRHLVQKGQKELEQAKKEKSETERLIELLEKRFNQEEVEKAKQQQPQVTEAQFVEELTRAYLPALAKVAEQGGIESDFIKEFPKAAVHLEHRFQSGGALLQGLVEEVGRIREFVGMQKEQLAEKSAVETFESLMDSVSEQGDLFSGLSDSAARKAFTDFLTDDSTKLRINQKEVKEITPDDVMSAWLFFAHKHPEVLQGKHEDRPKPDAHLAGGGRGKSPSPKTRKELDEFEKFQSEYQKTLDNAYDL